ncbi:MAG TPA: hypothetical protein VM778_09965 [Gemmatimonadota bacterium]|nr:hypothetical protein [Gemmatimonadota bacterium]
MPFLPSSERVRVGLAAGGVAALLVPLLFRLGADRPDADSTLVAALAAGPPVVRAAVFDAPLAGHAAGR